MGVDREVIDEAFREAEAAGKAAGVTVRVADPRDVPAVIGLFERTWGAGRSPDRSMLLALDYAGNPVLVAASAGKPVGATLGFLGWSGGIHLHSHMAAVVPWRRSGGVGYALKLFQRAVCLEQGITEIRWTFDPLIRRNAHFNLVKLGAEVIQFLPDFYGRLDDVINAGDRSDRFEVRWRLESERVRRCLGGHPTLEWSGAEGLPLNVDFERLRAEDPESATRLRDASRRVFAAALAEGSRPEVDADNNYVFTTDAPDYGVGPAAPESAAPGSAAPESAAPESAAPGSAAPESAAPESTAPEWAAPESAAPGPAVPESAAPPDSAHLIASAVPAEPSDPPGSAR
jgi:predicted GNAT superfamily acetyltransferase